MLYCNKQKIDIGFISKIITDGFGMTTTKYIMTSTTTTMQPNKHFNPTIDDTYHSTTIQTT